MQANLRFPYWGEIANYVSSENTLAAFGATAISRVSPVKPEFSLATFAGELGLDGLPDIPGWKVITERHKGGRLVGPATAVAGENLNWQFGWLPIARDIQTFCRAVATAPETTERYRREAGKELRRQYHGPEEVLVDTTTTLSTNASPLPAMTYLFGGKGKLERHTRTTRKRWFVGKFRYALPVGKSNLELMSLHAREANKLLGFVPTPDVVWNLTPWSWGVDWVSNVGDVMSNLSDIMTDSLVVDGHAMEHVQSSVTYTLTGAVLKNGQAVPPLSMTFVNETKQRVGATPFGFGLDPLDFTDRQISILLSLGLNRSGKQIRRA